MFAHTESVVSWNNAAIDLGPTMVLFHNTMEQQISYRKTFNNFDQSVVTT